MAAAARHRRGLAARSTMTAASGAPPSDAQGSPGADDFIREAVNADQQAGIYGGSVRTRFPPEPNGYLHIGHAKALLADYAIAAEQGGSCTLRFDDTNPDTAAASYAAAIREDLEWLGVEAKSVRYASSYFDQLYDWACWLIVRGLAYVDDQDSETISAQRGGFGQPGVDSPCRDRSAGENLSLFARMASGRFEPGSKVLRARIDMAHENMNMRDPVMYRIRSEPHYRLGREWHVYPTYDWAHGQSDAIEGVTHSLCSLEFMDHRPLYDWFLAQLPLERTPPRQLEFARLELTHTVTSKRLLRRLIDAGKVMGPDDPQLPTLRGLRRRGYPPEAIKEFCSFIGISRTNARHAIELLESFVRTHLNRTALRRMAVLRPVKLVITNWPTSPGGTPLLEMRELANNPEDPAAGTRMVPFTGELLIEREDVMVDPPPGFFRLAPGREVRLRNAYFVRCDEVLTDASGNVTEVRCTYDPATGGGSAPDGRKVKATLHWLAAGHTLDLRAALYDRLFTAEAPGAATGDPLDDLNEQSVEWLTDAVGEEALADCGPGTVVQFERLGYFACDSQPGTQPLTFHRTVGLRDEWANMLKRQHQDARQ